MKRRRTKSQADPERTWTSSLMPKPRKRHPERRESHFSVQNLLMQEPRRIAKVMQAAKARPPPIMMLTMPYLAARPIATTCETSPHSVHISRNINRVY